MTKNGSREKNRKQIFVTELYNSRRIFLGPSRGLPGNFCEILVIIFRVLHFFFDSQNKKDMIYFWFHACIASFF